jgi:hypothetical protein
LYGCETWSVTLREEHRLREFDNRVLRGIFGPKRGEVTGEWRKLHNEELYDLYCLPDTLHVIKSRRMSWAGHVARMEKRNTYRNLERKRKGKTLLGRTKSGWDHNATMYLTDRGWQVGTGTSVGLL